MQIQKRKKEKKSQSDTERVHCGPSKDSQTTFIV